MAKASPGHAAGGVPGGFDRHLAWWLALGWAGFAVLPWYAIEDGFWSFGWVAEAFVDRDYAPA